MIETGTILQNRYRIDRQIGQGGMSVISAGYFLNSGSSQSVENAGNTNSENTNNFFIKTENANVSEANVSVANNVLAGKESTDKSQNETPVRQNQTTRNNLKETKKPTGNPPAATAKSNKTDADEDALIINGETIETKDMVIDENGIRMRNPKPPLPPNAPPGQPRYLTPEQIRKLKRIENLRRRIIIATPPKPQSTP